MSDLYERLRAELARRNPWKAAKLWQAVEAVLELHKPSGCDRHNAGDGYCCTECGHTDNGCSTVRAIARALDVAE